MGLYPKSTECIHVAPYFSDVLFYITLKSSKGSPSLILPCKFLL